MDERQYVVILIKDPDYYGMVGVVTEEDGDLSRYKVEILSYTKAKRRIFIEVYKQNVKQLFNSAGKFIKPFKRTSAVQIIGNNTPYKGAYGDYTFINTYTLKMSLQLESHIGGVLNMSLENIKFIPLEVIESYDIVKPSRTTEYNNAILYSYDEVILSDSDNTSRSGSRIGTDSTSTRASGSNSTSVRASGTTSRSGSGSGSGNLERRVAMLQLESKSKSKSVDDGYTNSGIYNGVKKLYILLGISIPDELIEVEILKELAYVLEECNAKQLYDIKTVMISYLYIKLNQHLGVTDYFSIFEPTPKPFIPVRRNFKTLIYIVVRLAEIYYFKADNIIKSEDIYLEIAKNVKKVTKVLGFNADMYNLL
jgi:hypothetical protein